MKNSHRKSTPFSCLFLLAVALLPRNSSGLDLSSTAIAGGGGASSGGNFILVATVGQAAAGTSPNGAQLAMQTGFWPTSIPGSILKITSVIRLTNGHITLDGLGLPAAIYTVQASPDLSPGSFAKIGTTTADATALWHYDDAGAVGLTKRFYRLTFP